MSQPLLVLSSTHVDQISAELSIDDLVNLMATVFRELQVGNDDGSTGQAQNATGPVSIPHRVVVGTANHTVLFMPSRISNIGTAIKIVSVPSTSAPSGVKSHGLPASTMIIDEHSGDVVAIVNARKLTALRNAASQHLFSKLDWPSRGH